MNITLAKKNKTNFEYHMKGEILEEAQATMYLGITISSDLSWNKHINTMTAKANRVLNFLKRNLKQCLKPIKEKALMSGLSQNMHLQSGTHIPPKTQRI